MDTGVLDFFWDKKIILDYYFCLMSGPVFLFQIFIIAPLVIFIHLLDSGILLIIDLNKKKREKRGGEFYL
jgi:hypothetical protein